MKLLTEMIAPGSIASLTDRSEDGKRMLRRAKGCAALMNHTTLRAFAFFVIALAMLASSLHARADWPLIRGDANATGAVADPLPGPLDIVWTYETDESAFEATAAIADGIVYVGDVDGMFHAVKLADGTPAWTRKFEDTGFITGTAVVDGRIYCVDFNGVVRALNAADGEPLWEFNTESSLYAAPNVYKSRVLIVTDSGELISLDAATGKETWARFRIDQPLRCWPTVVEGRILVAGCDGLLHAVDVETGQAIENIDIGGPADGMPAVVGNRVYFCTAGGVFYAAEVKPLKSLWQYGHKGQSEEIHAAAVNDKAVVLGTHDKRLVALDPEQGGELWSFPLRARAKSSPVIVGDLAIAGTVRGRLHAVDMATGQEAWETEIGGQFIASPAVSDGRIVIGNDDGVLYCIGGPSK
jgi:outer membrane protein assembly factor BamB